MAQRVLVVDDDDAMRDILGEVLDAQGCHTTLAATGAEAIDAVAAAGFDLVMLDLHLPDKDGLGLIAEMLERQPELPIVIVTGDATVDAAVKAMRAGAVDYVLKPFHVGQLQEAIDRAMRKRRLEGADAAPGGEKKSRFSIKNIIGESPRIREIKELVLRIAQGDSTTVLLLGESGTGKDMIARAIHYESARVEAPFMNITCTALPETLLESELFGYEKGAFTNAHARKKGLFELAHMGTVFMDEVGDMPPSLQAKVLRILEDKTFKRIGGAEDIEVNVRVVAATNRDLLKRIEQGKFREDLYYRISILPIVMPPLRERLEDIALLCAHFLAVYNREFKRDFPPLSQAVIDKLHDYRWPGNVRELRNVLERAVLLCTGDEISPDDVVLGRFTFGNRSRVSGHVVGLPENGCVLDEVEKSLIVQAMERTENNQTKAAALLGVTRDQIRYKLGKYGITH